MIARIAVGRTRVADGCGGGHCGPSWSDVLLFRNRQAAARTINNTAESNRRESLLFHALPDHPSAPVPVAERCTDRPSHSSVTGRSLKAWRAEMM